MAKRVPIYHIKGTETASTKFQKVLFSWITKLEDCSGELTPHKAT